MRKNYKKDKEEGYPVSHTGFYPPSYEHNIFKQVYRKNKVD